MQGPLHPPQGGGIGACETENMRWGRKDAGPGFSELGDEGIEGDVLSLEDLFGILDVIAWGRGPL